MEKEILEYSAGTESRTRIDIQDYMPETLIKVYPYRTVSGSKDKKFMQENSVTVANISQTPFQTMKDSGVQTIKTDENGKLYFEVYGIYSDDLGVIRGVDNEENNNTILNSTSLTCMINHYWRPDEYKADFFSFEKPFDQDAFEKGNQRIFYIAQFNEIDSPSAIDEKISDLVDVLDNSRIGELMLQDISSLERSFGNSRLIFIEGDDEAFKKVKVLKRESDGTNTELSGVSIDVERTTLINNITGKGLIKDEDSDFYSDIDLKSEHILTPIKMTPISVREKATFFADWFDYDTVMPLNVSKRFLDPNGVTLDQVKAFTEPDSTDPNIQNKLFSDAQINLIEDMLMVSYAYASNFVEFERVTDTSDKDYGKLKPNQFLGHAQIQLQPLEGKEPYVVVDRLFDKYIREHPEDEDSRQIKIVRQMINAMSRYIYSSYAIGKGSNSFNKIYLPWYLQPVGPIKKKTVTNHESGYQYHTLDTATVKLTTRSLWFEPKTGDMDILKDVNISEVDLKQTDRKLTMPLAGETLDEVSKLPLPGDISTTTSKDLKYMWYTPFDQETMKKIYLWDNVVPTASQQDITDVVLSPFASKDKLWTDWGSTLAPLTDVDAVKALTESLVRKLYKVSAGEAINVDLTGATVIERTSTETKKKIMDKKWNFWTGLPYPTSSLNTDWDTLTDEQRKLTFKKITGEDIENVRGVGETVDFSLQPGVTVTKWHNVMVNGKQVGPSVATVYSTQTRQFYIAMYWKLVSEQYTGIKISTKVDAFAINEERRTTFDKPEWFNFVKGNYNKSNVITLYLKEKFDGVINEIRELELNTMWANEFVINFNSYQIKVPAFNKEREQLVKQTIIFY